MAKGKTGAPTGSIVTSPSKAKRIAKRRREEEKLWRSKNGPVTVRNVKDSEPEI